VDPPAGDRRRPPRIDGVLETALYVEDLGEARKFYETVLGLDPLLTAERVCAYDVGGRDVLLLFVRGATVQPQSTPGGMIPPHDGSGPQHFALAISADLLDSWEHRLAAYGVEIESQVKWPRGGTSVYFRDPDGHLIELATPGIWATY
jgi:catechol 2,3-dioxygenase-like lactoylglutathione lyase family enzyme